MPEYKQKTGGNDEHCLFARFMAEDVQYEVIIVVIVVVFVLNVVVVVIFVVVFVCFVVVINILLLIYYYQFCYIVFINFYY